MPIKAGQAYSTKERINVDNDIIRLKSRRVFCTKASLGTGGLGQVSVLTHQDAHNFDEYLFRKVAPKKLVSIGLLLHKPSPGLTSISVQDGIRSLPRPKSSVKDLQMDTIRPNTSSSNLASNGRHKRSAQAPHLLFLVAERTK